MTRILISILLIACFVGPVLASEADTYDIDVLRPTCGGSIKLLWHDYPAAFNEPGVTVTGYLIRHVVGSDQPGQMYLLYLASVAGNDRWYIAFTHVFVPDVLYSIRYTWIINYPDGTEERIYIPQSVFLTCGTDMQLFLPLVIG
jgi:hypothetical protein